MKGFILGLSACFWGQISFLPLVLFLPFLVFPEYFPRVVVLTLAGLLVAYAVGHALLAGRRCLTLVVLLVPFPILGAVSYWASADKEITLPKLLLLLTGIVTVLLFAVIKRDSRGESSSNLESRISNFELWAYLFVGGVLILGLLGPFVTEYKWSAKFIDLRVLGYKLFQTGEILDVNLLGCLMAVTIPLAFVLAIQAPGLKTQVVPGLRWAVVPLHWLVFALLVLLLVTTQARAALVGMSAGMVLVVALVSRWARWIILVCIPLGVLALYLSGFGEIGEILSKTGSLGTAEVRLELWNRSMYAIQDFPFTGIGAGMFKKVIPLLYPLFLIAPDATPFHSHNLFLQVALDLGVPGLVAFVALVVFSVLVGVNGVKGRRSKVEDRKSKIEVRTSEKRIRLLVIGYLGGLAGFLVNGMLDSPLWMNKPHLVPFFIIGMLIALGSTKTPNPNPQFSTWRLIFDFSILFVLWILISLVAISFVGEHPYWTLTIAVLGGGYIGWEAGRQAPGGRPAPVNKLTR